MLATALIGAYDANGAKILLRALLDQGSQSSFISETAAQTLGLKREKIDALVSGIGEKVQKAKSMIRLQILPRFESKFSMHTNAVVLPKLTKITNNASTKMNFDFLNNLSLADPSFLNKSEIDIILGAAEYAHVLKMGLMKSDDNLIAQNTELGWIVSGALNTAGPMLQIVTLITNVELEKKVKNFFREDEFESQNELSMRKIIVKNTSRKTCKMMKMGVLW